MRMDTVETRRGRSLRFKWLLAVGALTLFSFVAWFSPGVQVIVRNSATVPVRNVQVKFKGGAKRIPAISPGQAISVSVNPSGESDLALEFDLGTRHGSQIIDVYIEHDYAGTVFVTVDNAGNIHVLNRIKLWWFTPAPKG